VSLTQILLRRAGNRALKARELHKEWKGDTLGLWKWLWVREL